MSLTPAQLKARDGKLTASRVACLMTGDAEKMLNLWREMVGDPAFVAEDLSGVWPIKLGEMTEPLNLSWYSRTTGRALTRCGEVVVHPEIEWAAATLDGFDAVLNAVVECKHVGGFETADKILARYQPQLQWQMAVTDAPLAILSVIYGAKEPVLEEIPADGVYVAELWRRAHAFMECVFSLTPPVALAPVAAPVKPVRVVDMSASNSWASAAGDWLANKKAARAFDAASKDLKELVAADAMRAFGHGVECIRDRAGRLSIKPVEA